MAKQTEILRQYALEGARAHIARILVAFPELRADFTLPADERRVARRLLARAVKRAERNGNPADNQKELWAVTVAASNGNPVPASEPRKVDPKPTKLHWTQTPAGRRKMSRIQRQAWKDRSR